MFEYDGGLNEPGCINKRSSMEQITDSEIYEAIGAAVISSQMFERTFVTAAKLAIKQADAETIEDVVPLRANAFKQPVKAILNEISEVGPMPDLASRIGNLIEERHRVVHRLLGEGNWPGDTSPVARFEIRALCIRVTSESIELNEIMQQLLTRWMGRFPQFKEKLNQL